MKRSIVSKLYELHSTTYSIRFNFLLYVDENLDTTENCTILKTTIIDFILSTEKIAQS